MNPFKFSRELKTLMTLLFNDSIQILKCLKKIHEAHQLKPPLTIGNYLNGIGPTCTVVFLWQQ